MVKKLEALLEEEKVKLEDALVENSSTETNKEEVVESTSDFDASADIEAIFKDMDVSEEFKQKAARVYEASVIALATQVSENIATELKEHFETETAQIIEQYETNLNEEVNGYLKFVTEKWINENEVQATNVVRSEIAESFMDGLRELLVSHYVDLPEDKVDLVAEMEEANQKLTAKTNSLLEDIIALRKVNDNLVREQIVKEHVSGLSDFEKDKFEKLSEAIEYTSTDDYNSRLDEIRQSYFTETTQVTKSNFENEDPIELVEEVRPQLNSGFNVNSVLSHLGKTRRTTASK